MPSQRKHYNASIKDFQFYILNTKNFSEHPEWAIILMFYEIMHLVERVFSIAPLQKDFQHSRSHSQRFKTLEAMRSEIPRNIRIQYRLIYNLSIQSRYEYGKISEEKYKSINQNEYKVLKSFFKSLYTKFRKRIK